MSQTLAADIDPAIPPKICFARVNNFHGNNRLRSATTLAFDDFRFAIAPEEIV